jgi:cell division ATPase FtsA
VLSGLGIERVKFIPSSLAQACYLMSEKMREGYAFLLDVGYLTSTISVVYGNGIVREENFDCGLGQIIAALMEQLNIEYALAEEMLSFAIESAEVISVKARLSSDTLSISELTSSVSLEQAMIEETKISDISTMDNILFINSTYIIILELRCCINSLLGSEI